MFFYINFDNRDSNIDHDILIIRIDLFLLHNKSYITQLRTNAEKIAMVNKDTHKIEIH